MNQIEALTFAYDLMKQRNYCEIAISRIIIKIKQLPEPISIQNVKDIVIGNENGKK